MYTIKDYLKYYKDTTIKDVPWNMMDNLICTILAYSKVKEFDECELSNFCTSVKKYKPKKDEIMEIEVLYVVNAIENSKRYEHMKFKNFVNIRNNKVEFGALTCIIDDIKVIAFKGTGGSRIGWIENFRLAYTYPTDTQRCAYAYLKQNVSVFDKNVYVVGHSKGGNLAMSSAMELNPLKYRAIKRIVNFDGPGFRKKEYVSAKYKKISQKLTNIIPDHSYIGILLYNENYTTIKTKVLGTKVHYPFYWDTYGDIFINSKLSNTSTKMHDISSEKISSFDEKKLKEIMEDAYLALKNNDRFSIKDIKLILNRIKENEQEDAIKLYNTLVSFTKIQTNSKEGSKK